MPILEKAAFAETITESAKSSENFSSDESVNLKEASIGLNCFDLF